MWEDIQNFTNFYITFLILSSVYRVWRRRKYNTKGKREGSIIRYAKPICTIQIVFYIILSISCIVEYFLLKRTINLLVSIIGIVLYLFGIIGREWVVKTLGEYWSPHIEIKENHKLVKEGPYRYLRHPNSFLLQAEVTGLALIPNSYYSLFFVWLVYFPLTLIRIHLEEHALIEKFGKEYIDYKKEVWALLPLRKVKKR